MTRSDPPLEAIKDIRELNRLFLGFLRDRANEPGPHFGLPAQLSALVAAASAEELDRAASFPRALFRLRLPEGNAVEVRDTARLGRDAGKCVLELTLLHSARNLCRMSGYWARLLLRLNDDEVNRLRNATVDEIVAMSPADNLVRAAFDDLDWIWSELLTEARPEYRRRLLLIGFQPEAVPTPVPGLA